MLGIVLLVLLMAVPAWSIVNPELFGLFGLELNCC